MPSSLRDTIKKREKMLEALKDFAEKFLSKVGEKNKRDVLIVSHYDTDGITSAAILAKALKRIDVKFYVKIVKQLEKNTIDELSKLDNKIIIFLDLGSGSLHHLADANSEFFVVDHHEITKEVPKNVHIINPHIYGEENVSGACLAYLLAKEIDIENKDLANLAVIGMVGDMLEKEICKINNELLNDAEVIVKKGLLLYPATRPLHKTLEFATGMFIPGVTGSSRGAINLLQEAGIKKDNGEYKSLIELDDDEMSRIITAILLHVPHRDMRENLGNLIGNIYLIKFFGRLEDARELSAMINACGRLGCSEVALALCLGDRKAKSVAESLYAKYKQHIVAALDYISKSRHITGKDYIIINAKNEIMDTIIGTAASILSNSQAYEKGTIIIAMAYSEDKIKVSARIAGRNGRNIRELLEDVVKSTGGECGGHPAAAGCLISREKEFEFLEMLKKRLEVEIVKI
ncbi:MAG TPA: DHH family phosphoesterase [Candidatus Nanoarchaeia archaeon]|nr:DHH family phosphoesterase [Candidatus Nanoarchaeia archaeon]